MKHFLLILTLILLTNFQSAFAQCMGSVNAGADQTACSDVSISGSATGGYGGAWTTSGSGYFQDSLSLNNIYYPSEQDKISGSVTLTLTSYDTSCASNISDALIVTLIASPTVTGGPDQTICADGSSVSLNAIMSGATGVSWITTGTGTFTNPTSTNTSYITTAADIASGGVMFTVQTTGNGLCNAAYDSVVIVISPSPTVNAGFDQTICSGNNATLNGTVGGASGGIWFTTGTGTFSPNATSLSTNYVPSLADQISGSIALTLTTTGNGTCNAVADTMIIYLTPAPTVNAGPDQTFCANGTATLNGSVTIAVGGVWTSSGSGIFSPNASSLNTSYIPSFSDQVNGTVVLTLTSTGNGTCFAVSDNTTITLTTPPTVDAGLNQSMSAGVTLNGSVTVATGGIWTTTGSGVFSPNATTLNGNYIPSAADLAIGHVTLSLTTTGNGTCSPVSDKLVLTSNTEVCNVSITTTATDNKIVFQASNDDGTSVGSYFWNFGDGIYAGEKTQSHVYAAAGSYNVTLFYSTPDSSCTATQSTIVTIANTAIPTYSLSGVIKAGANNLDEGLVLLFKLNNTQYDLLSVVTLTASNNGAYNFSNLDNGTYLLSTIIDTTSSYFFNYIPAYFGNVEKWNDATALVVNNGNLSSKDINLIAYTCPDNTWNTGSDSIKGVLTFDATVVFRTTATATENPSANALVKLYNSNNELLTSTYTDEFGNYSFGNLISGDYKITVEYAGGVTSDLAINVDGNPLTITDGTSVVLKEAITTGISKNTYKVFSLQMYPNPAATDLNIQLPSDVNGNTIVYIYSSLGKLVYQEVYSTISGANIPLEINSLLPGIYIVEISSEEKIFKGKFAKN